jgi:hypothetical protein
VHPSKEELFSLRRLSCSYYLRRVAACPPLLLNPAALYGFPIMKEPLEKSVYSAFSAKGKQEHGQGVHHRPGFEPPFCILCR